MKKRTFRTCSTLLAAAAIAIVAASVGAARKADKLTLRINDAEGARGEVVAVVLRTYSSRPLGQGQICFTASRPGAARRAEKDTRKMPQAPATTESRV